MELNPVNTELVDKIKNIERQVTKYTVNNQPYIGDWLQISDIVEYVSSTSIRYSDTSITASDYFAIGDPVRWKQTGDGNYRYGYVVSLTGATIGINSGTDYSVANLTITELWRGIKNNPTGFPYTFNFNPNFRTNGTTLSSLDSQSYLFWITGNVCYVDLHFETANLSGNNTSIVCDLPVEPSVVLATPFIPYVATNYYAPAMGSILQTGGVKLFDNTPGYNAEFQIIEYTGISGTGQQYWFASTGFIGIDATFSYIF